MCGRYAIHVVFADLRWHISPTVVLGSGAPSYSNYNACPSLGLPVLRSDKEGGHVLDELKWGLRPGWAREKGRAPINARCETVSSSPMFRDAYRSRRCVVPISGFYEWAAGAEGGRKQPWYIYPATSTIPSNPSVLAPAGVWDFHEDSGPNFAIITTSANELMAPIHARLPAITIDPEQVGRSLAPSLPAGAPLPALDLVAKVEAADPRAQVTYCTVGFEEGHTAAFSVQPRLDPKTGEARLSRVLSVVENVENESTEVTLEEAQQRNADAKIGDLIAEPLPPLDFGRVAAQNAKQVIVQKVREAERERHYNEYKDRIGEIVNGTVKRVEYGNVIVDLGRAEGVIRRDEMIPRENVRYGDRIRAYIYDVRREPRGPQIFLSRARPEFMSKLFAQEVPEIYDGVVEIKSVARDPGSRAKIAVISKDSSIDPVGACVGMRGSRVQAVVNELQGEKVDIIQWNPDAASFIVNGLAPAEVTKVVLDEDTNRIEVVVPETQLSLAIGRRGQNVRLASQLTGWDIDILTEQEESERRQKEFSERSNMLMESLDVDEVIAQLLVTEGFASIEEVAYVDVSEISHIEGFDEHTANEIQSRARDYLEKLEADRDAKRRELGVADDLAEIAGVTTAMMVAFGENDVKTVEDLADCATDDLVGWTERKKEKDAEPVRHKGILEGFEIGRKEAEDMIMAARVHAGWISPEDLLPEPDPEAEDAEGEGEVEGEAGAEAAEASEGEGKKDASAEG